jgi:hypothetical protein
MQPEPRTDPFFERMFARMSPGAEYLFSPYQLDEIKKAFSARTFGAHGLDFRTSVRLFRNSFYFIVLAGRERRLRSRFPAAVLVAASLLAASSLGGVLAYAVR